MHFPKIFAVAFLSALVLSALACDPEPLSSSDPGVGTDATGDTGHAEPDAELDADAEPDVSEEPPEPAVAFAAPSSGETLPNPVLFRVDAVAVDEVEIFADETYSLGPAFDPADTDELLFRFAGTGFERSLHVVGRVDGEEVARADLAITVTDDTCEDRFFLDRFDSRNEDASGELDMFTIRETSLMAIKAEVEALQACGAQITLGAILSLLMFESALRAGSFNTRCNENSYHNTESDCDLVAEALYSYQFGIGAIHTSNFHPCRGGSYTQGMRALFADIAADAGFPTEDLLTPELQNRFHDVCPDATPSAVDYYILGAHEPFGIPRNDNGNHLVAVGDYPFLDPHVSVPLTFSILYNQCSTISDDRDAIARWGGGDARYAETAYQNNILAHYENYAAAHCD